MEQVLERLKEYWGKQNLTAKALIVGLPLLLIIVGVSSIALLGRQPVEMAVLVTDAAEKDAVKIVEELDKQGISYQIKNDGKDIYVPLEAVDKLRMDIAGLELHGAHVGHDDRREGGVMLELTGLHAGYGRTMVLHGVDLTVPAGGVAAVLGHNGAGKTTLLRTALGLLKARSGSVVLDGEDVTRLPTHQRVRRGLAYVPQGQQSFGDLTARENLAHAAAIRLRGEPEEVVETRIDARLADLGLLHCGNRLVQSLSGGEKKMLSFVRGLSEAQPLLLLDEPSEGVQWENIEHIAAAIGQAKAQGRAFVVVEQNLAFAELIADRYLVVEQGRVVREGMRGELTREQLLAHLHV